MPVDVCGGISSLPPDGGNDIGSECNCPDSSGAFMGMGVGS
jgi:uncharacterized Zn finger protein